MPWRAADWQTANRPGPTRSGHWRDTLEGKSHGTSHTIFKARNPLSEAALGPPQEAYSGTIMRDVQLLTGVTKLPDHAWCVYAAADEDWTERLGLSDDFDDADGKNVLTFLQAQASPVNERRSAGPPMISASRRGSSALGPPLKLAAGTRGTHRECHSLWRAPNWPTSS
jgi:hypothetical protein